MVSTFFPPRCDQIGAKLGKHIQHIRSKRPVQTTTKSTECVWLCECVTAGKMKFNYYDFSHSNEARGGDGRIQRLLN